MKSVNPANWCQKFMLKIVLKSEEAPQINEIETAVINSFFSF
jgi:hypothetical protein